jgi:hypothetical protein
VQQHGELARDGDHRVLLAVAATARAQLQAVAAQVGVLAERTEDPLRSGDQEPAQEGVPAFADRATWRRELLTFSYITIS